VEVQYLWKTVSLEPGSKQYEELKERMKQEQEQLLDLTMQPGWLVFKEAVERLQNAIGMKLSRADEMPAIYRSQGGLQALYSVFDGVSEFIEIDLEGKKENDG
jgi:hypothetical protein